MEDVFEYFNSSRNHAADIIRRRADLTPGRVALVELATGVQYSFAELNARANRCAYFLQHRLDIQKGDRVSILAHNSVVYLDLLFGLAKIGAVFAPLNWRLTAKELVFILENCSPKAVFCGPEFTDVLAEIQNQTAFESIITVEGASFSGSLDYESETAGLPETEPDMTQISGETPLCLLYTSGTTGSPKGAVLPHRQVLWNCINTVISWGLTERDITPVFTPLYHTGGLFAFMVPLLYAGGRVILARSFDPDESLHIIEAESCTVVLGVPTLFQLWENSPKFADADFSRVHFFISGGAACPVHLMERWRAKKGVIFRQGYGLTEAGPNCFSMTDEESDQIAGSVGKPIFHSSMRLVNPDTKKDVPPGLPGELLIRGSHVFAGYWMNPEATAAALEDGWLHTGDTAVIDQNGYYSIIGRYKDMIISGGENIYAAEVEAIFREHPAVADAALIGMPHSTWGEVGLMVVTFLPGQEVAEQELISFCEGKLARYKVPKQVIFTDALPYSPYGKVEKIKLRERYLPAGKSIR